MYYYTEILGKLVDFDHKALIKQLLRFEKTDRTSQENWMRIIKVSPKQWDWVIKYGQFEPEGEETTEKEKRKKRQNTFAPEVPTGWIQQNGGMDDGTAPKNAKPRIKNKLSQTPRPLTHKLARDTTQYIQHQQTSTSTQLQHNNNTTQHNTHQKSTCKSVDSNNRMGWCRFSS